MAEVPPITVEVDVIARAVVVKVHKMRLEPDEWLVVRVPEDYSTAWQRHYIAEAIAASLALDGLTVPLVVVPNSFTLTTIKGTGQEL
jgi:hypothetical protein